ncbi:MAG TPA: Na+/H+ antiporter subunit E, partial [Ignavibacteria bacterium]|nr:Na+/H+ antiporter subunit E [Ignavibacteria bacterium]
MLKKTILILVPAIVWLFFTGSMNLLNIFLGLLLSYILFLIYGNFSVSKRRKIKILKILNLFAYFIWELILANLRV